MKIHIVTTTINKPTEATIKFCKIASDKSFQFTIVGDKKTPHQEYLDLSKKYSSVNYLSPDDQDKLYLKLSSVIGWNTIQRRNIGFVYAISNGADIIATVDDDNIPYDSWGDNICINTEIETDMYHTDLNIFDPLSVTNNNDLWHRGFPIELVPIKNNVIYYGKKYIKPLIQADLWDGDPDIDALCRLSKKPTIKFDIQFPYASNKISPFNSQNTFVHKSVMKYYCVFPFVGRMDDIWPSYIVQYFFPNSLIYNKATVYQNRNVQDLVTNLEKEIIGYRLTNKLVNDIINYENYLPDDTKKFYSVYQEIMDKLI
jgi:hypothetical protein